MFAGSRVVGVMQVGLVWNKRKEVVFRIECKPDVTKEDSVRMTGERILVVHPLSATRSMAATPTLLSVRLASRSPGSSPRLSSSSG